MRLCQQVLALLTNLGTVDATGTVFLNIVSILHRNIGTHQEGDDLLVDLLDHGAEQVERFKFIDHQRVLLLVGGILHRFLQVVEFTEVLFPSIVDQA